MKLILTKEVAALGDIGTIVSVKGGYARNYLIPRGYALPASKSNTNQLEHQQRILAKKRERILEGFRATAAKLGKLSLTVAKQVGEDGRIFGSVTTAELHEQLEAAQIDVSKKLMTLPDEVKTIGRYEAAVRLHPEVQCKLAFEVVAQNQDSPREKNQEDSNSQASPTDDSNSDPQA